MRVKPQAKACATIVLLAGALGAQTNERKFLDQYCVGCHNEKIKTAGLMLDRMDPAQVGSAPETWEKVVRKLRSTIPPRKSRIRGTSESIG